MTKNLILSLYIQVKNRSSLITVAFESYRAIVLCLTTFSFAISRESRLLGLSLRLLVWGVNYPSPGLGL